MCVCVCCVTPILSDPSAVPSLGLGALTGQLRLQILPLLPQQVPLPLKLQRGAAQGLQLGMLGVGLLLQRRQPLLHAVFLAVRTRRDETEKIWWEAKKREFSKMMNFLDSDSTFDRYTEPVSIANGHNSKHD